MHGGERLISTDLFFGDEKLLSLGVRPSLCIGKPDNVKLCAVRRPSDYAQYRDMGRKSG
jgi:hypothetical protein